MATTLKGKIANLREHILTRNDLDEEPVYVPGWDCTVLVRALTGAERAKYQQQITTSTPGAQQGQQAQIRYDRFWADLVIMSTRNPEDGTLLFSPTDRNALLEKAAKNLEQVAAVARRLSGLNEDALPKSQSNTEE